MQAMHQALRSAPVSSRLWSNERACSDSETKRNSNHNMGDQSIRMRIVLDSILRTYSCWTECRTISIDDWARMISFFELLRQPRKIMERLFADQRITIYILAISSKLLLKNRDDCDKRLKQTDALLTTKSISETLVMYKERRTQKPATVCTYVSPKISNPTNETELSSLLEVLRGMTERRYSWQASMRLFISASFSCCDQ